MKKMIVLACIMALGLMLMGCGVKQNELDKGHELVNKGDCTGATPYLEDTIAMPDDILDLGYAYFLMGRCAEKAGDKAAAYENYYAAKIVACYAVAHDTHASLNSYGRSEFCQVKIPAILEKLAPELGAAEVDRITKKVDGVLHARYLERFYKNKSH